MEKSNTKKMQKYGDYEEAKKEFINNGTYGKVYKIKNGNGDYLAMKILK